MAEETTGGPCAPKRVIELPVPEYPGFLVKIWANMPNRLLVDLDSGNESRVVAALLEIVLEHNNWRDHKGQPYPPASTPEFWDAIPQELAGVVIRGCIPMAVAQLPNSLAPKRRSSGSTSAPSTEAPVPKA